MCTLSAIRIQVLVFGWFKGLMMIYVFGAGCYLASSTIMRHAFGEIFLHYGLSLIFIAILSCITIYPMQYAVNRHNRFVLILVFLFESVVFIELLNLGHTIFLYTYPQFKKELQGDCLKNTPTVYSADECDAFYKADRTAGMRLMWDYFFSQKDSKSIYQIITTIQDLGACCGFFQPFNCQANTESYPSAYSATYISSSLLRQRVICSSYPLYYPQQDNCADVYDPSTNPPTIGGCYYDLGVSFCLQDAITPNSAGCASAAEDYVSKLLAPHGPIIMALSLFSALFIILSCCMYFKRKETDVFPAFTTQPEVR